MRLVRHLNLSYACRVGNHWHCSYDHWNCSYAACDCNCHKKAPMQLEETA